MGTRNTIGIFTEVWASTGDRSVIADFEEGFGFEYQVDTAPDRRNMNDVLAKATAVCVDINKYGGALPWNNTITYEAGAHVTASDNRLYRALLQNLNKDPLTNPAEWENAGGLATVYTLTPPAGGDLRTFDPNTATFGQIADVLATLIKDLT